MRMRRINSWGEVFSMSSPQSPYVWYIRKIDVSLGDFPPEFLKHKVRESKSPLQMLFWLTILDQVLPELLKAVEFGGAGAKALTPILKIGGKLTQDEFNTLILPSIISLFASQDRAIRYSLCENLEGFVKFIPDKVVNDKIFPSLATGFSDVNVRPIFNIYLDVCSKPNLLGIHSGANSESNLTHGPQSKSTAV